MEYNHKIYLLFGLVLFGLINQVFSKSTNQDDNEYMLDEYDDEAEEQVSHENKTTERAINETVPEPPFFPSPREKYHVKLGSNAELRCSVKQLSANNVIIWYKGKNAIVTGKHATNSHYKILDDFSLLIQNATYEDGGDYYCEVIPQLIRLHVEVQIDEKDTSPEEQQAPAEHNQASQIGQQVVTESDNPSDNGCNGQISQSVMLTLLTIGLTSVLRI